MDITINEAKGRLDSLIAKARIQFYKPIQVAEILYQARTKKDINLLDLETYRSVSKLWRNEISSVLVGRISTSTSRFQDNLFEANAIPPKVLNILSYYNCQNNGVVESYIYHTLRKRLLGVRQALDYCIQISPEKFQLNELLEHFWSSLELRRSVDKIYEIVVYALFSAIIECLDVRIQLSVASKSSDLLLAFEDLVGKVLGLSSEQMSREVIAKLYRVGTTNAADRGLDMWGNFGVAIQVKHLSLTEKLYNSIHDSVRSERLIIVCTEADKQVLATIVGKLGADSVKGIITSEELNCWYVKAMALPNSDLGKVILEKLKYEVESEFPSIGADNLDRFIQGRGYVIPQDELFQLGGLG